MDMDHEDFAFAPEMERLERALSHRPRPQPPTALRRRVLADVRAELRRELAPSRWRFAAAAAAAAVAMICFSTAVVQATGLPFQREPTPSLQQVADRIQKISPDVSPQEAIRRAMLVRIGADLGCRTELTDRVGM